MLVALSPFAARLAEEPDLHGLLLVTASTFLLKPFTGSRRDPPGPPSVLPGRKALLRRRCPLRRGDHLAEADVGDLSLVVGLQVNAVGWSTVALWLFSRGRRRGSDRRSPPAGRGTGQWPIAGEIAKEPGHRLPHDQVFYPPRSSAIYHFAFILIAASIEPASPA